jgi:hypothetical protein
MLFATPEKAGALVDGEQLFHAPVLFRVDPALSTYDGSIGWLVGMGKGSDPDPCPQDAVRSADFAGMLSVYGPEASE